jgi:hypothetical protein
VPGGQWQAFGLIQWPPKRHGGSHTAVITLRTISFDYCTKIAIPESCPFHFFPANQKNKRENNFHQRDLRKI